MYKEWTRKKICYKLSQDCGRSRHRVNVSRMTLEGNFFSSLPLGMTFGFCTPSWFIFQQLLEGLKNKVSFTAYKADQWVLWNFAYFRCDYALTAMLSIEILRLTSPKCDIILSGSPLSSENYVENLFLIRKSFENTFIYWESALSTRR